VSLSPPSTFLCVAWSCTVVDKKYHTIGAIQVQRKGFLFYEESLLGRNCVQRKNFLFYEELLLERNWVQRKNFLFYEE
jgi:hypothetical protein